jgi:hypothetical protein
MKQDTVTRSEDEAQVAGWFSRPGPSFVRTPIWSAAIHGPLGGRGTFFVVLAHLVIADGTDGLTERHGDGLVGILLLRVGRSSVP